MQYRRANQPGGTYFFTVVTYERRKLFIDEATVDLLRQAVRSVMANHPFEILASVILPDHLHMIWKLPEDDADFSTRWRLIKAQFSHRYLVKPAAATASRMSKGEQNIWQRRFWEHLIRDEQDLHRHIEYIH